MRARGRVLSPEEGAQVRRFVEDVVVMTLDEMLALGYLQRVEGGHGQERIGPGGSPSLTDAEKYVTLEVVRSVVTG